MSNDSKISLDPQKFLSQINIPPPLYSGKGTHFVLQCKSHNRQHFMLVAKTQAALYKTWQVAVNAYHGQMDTEIKIQAFSKVEIVDPPDWYIEQCKQYELFSSWHQFKNWLSMEIEAFHRHTNTLPQGIGRCRLHTEDEDDEEKGLSWNGHCISGYGSSPKYTISQVLLEQAFLESLIQANAKIRQRSTVQHSCHDKPIYAAITNSMSYSSGLTFSELCEILGTRSDSVRFYCHKEDLPVPDDFVQIWQKRLSMLGAEKQKDVDTFQQKRQERDQKRSNEFIEFLKRAEQRVVQ